MSEYRATVHEQINKLLDDAEGDAVMAHLTLASGTVASGAVISCTEKRLRLICAVPKNPANPSLGFSLMEQTIDPFEVVSIMTGASEEIQKAYKSLWDAPRVQAPSRSKFSI